MSALPRRRRRNRRRLIRPRVPVPLLGSVADVAREEKTVVVPFRHRLFQEFPDGGGTFTTYSIECLTNLGDRVMDLSDSYILYRIRDMTVTFISNYATNSAENDGYYCACARGPLTAGAISSIEEMVDTPAFQIGSMAQPSRTVLRLPPSFWSKRHVEWFYTRDQGDDSLFVAAKLTVATITGGTYVIQPFLNIILDGVLEFSSPIDAGVNPESVPHKMAGGTKGHKQGSKVEELVAVPTDVSKKEPEPQVKAPAESKSWF